MPLGSVTKIFQGNTPRTFHAVVQACLAAMRKRYDRLCIPCVGEFMAARLAVAAGWPPHVIETSDVSLYTTALAGFIAKQDIEQAIQLWTVEGEEYERMRAQAADEEERYMALFLYLKWCQLRKNVHYEAEHARDLLVGFRRHVAHSLPRYRKIREELHGIQYAVEDMRAVMGRMNQQAIAGYVNPPAYASGYARMYKFDGRVRGGPDVAEYSHRYEFWPDFRRAAEAVSLQVWFALPEIPQDLRDRVIYGVYQPRMTPFFLLANRPQELNVQKTVFVKADALHDTSRLPKLKYHDVLTPDMKITMHRCSREVALALRDLWAHRLAQTDARDFYYLAVGGKVFAVVGLTPSALLKGLSEYVFENFAFSAPSGVYPRLNRLAMWCFTSREFWQRIARSRAQAISLYEPRGLQTTCLSRYRKLKLNNRIMELRSREKMRQQGVYKLVYTADWHDMDFQECLRHFLEEERTRQTERGKRSEDDGTPECEEHGAVAGAR